MRKTLFRWFLGMVGLVSFLTLTGQSSANFERFSTLNGLPQNSVFNITQDSQGFIWLATYDGISRFDGTHFRTYQPDPGNLRGISSNITITLKAGKNQQLWVGTTGSGFSVFDTRLLVFENYQADNSGPGVLSNNNITCIELAEEHIWIGTRFGLNLFFRESSKIIPFTREQGLAGNQIQSVYFDGNGQLWVSTEGGVQLMTFSNGELTELKRFESAVTQGLVRQIFEDSENRIWLLSSRQMVGFERSEAGEWVESARLEAASLKTCLSGSFQFNVMEEGAPGEFWLGTDTGLLRLNLNNGVLLESGCFVNNVNDVTSLPGNQIISLFTDQEGILWIGTRFSGLAKYDPYKQHITRYMHAPDRVNSLYSNDVRAISEDGYGNLWVGYRNEGLDYINRKSGVVRHFHADYPTGETLKSNSIRALYLDRQKTLWVGYNGGFARIDYQEPFGVKIVPAMDHLGQPVEMEGTAYVFFEDRKADFWIGTSQGLLKYDRQTGQNQWVIFSEEDLPEGGRNFIRSIGEDQQGFLWLATDGNGVYQYHPVSGEKRIYRHFLGDSASLAHNKVYSIVVDQDHKIWLGTHNGLSLFNPERDNFTNFTQDMGLSNNIVYGIMPEKTGVLWMSTANGISKFNPQTNSFKTYLTGFEFSDDAYSQNREGKIYAGGLNGFFAFHPDSLLENRYTPPIRFTELRLFNRPVAIGEAINGRVWLPHALSYLDELVLHYEDTFFSIEFAALSYASPEQNRYQFRLEGLHNHWIEADTNNRMATFSKLPPGHYVLRVRGANADGIWGESSLKINVLPAYYQTPLFRWAIVLIITMIILLFYRLRLRSLTHQKIDLQKRVADKTSELVQQNQLLLQQKEEIKLQNDKVVEMARLLREADERKLQFFTNISHEIKTPLTLIKGPVDQLAGTRELDPAVKMKLGVVQKYTDRLAALVHQLLDFRKIDSGFMMLNCRWGDLKKVVHEMALFYQPFFDKKQLQFNLDLGLDAVQGCFDESVVEKVVSNLLSNAVKYTPEGGKVHLSLEMTQHNLIPYALIQVTDSGIGIPDRYRNRIFERFYRISEEESNLRAEGSGIGLALSRDLARLHGGDLVLTDSGNHGSTFLFTLPLQDALQQPGGELQPGLSVDIPPLVENNPNFRPEQSSVLIMEDNDDLRSFIASGLEEYQLFLARDGDEGLKMAMNHLPDLIVSDIMMPGMNGFEVCSRLKANAVTNHIPIILLTALESSEHQQVGIEMGADDYIVKPFNIKVLAGKIRNRLIAQQKLREQVLGGLSGAFDSKAFPEDPFLSEAMELLQRNFSDSSFGVEELGALMNMSRSTFYRKIKALTGITPVEFVRRVRISESCRLLNSVSGITINELAYRVGFEDVNYFRECFKKQMGKTPTEYLSHNGI